VSFRIPNEVHIAYAANVRSESRLFFVASVEEIVKSAPTKKTKNWNAVHYICAAEKTAMTNTMMVASARTIGLEQERVVVMRHAISGRVVATVHARGKKSKGRMELSGRP